MDWFRLYNQVLDDPKVQRLDPSLFKSWINLLCLASEQDERGSLPDIGDIAFRLRMDTLTTATVLADLIKATLLDQDGEWYSIHNWPKYQYPSDNSTSRVRKYRERHKTVTETDVTNSETKGNVSVTPQNRADTEQIQSRVEQSRERDAPDQKPKRKVQVPDDWQPTEHGIAFASERGIPDITGEVQKFRDSHRSKGNVFLDLDAAWRTWCGRHKDFDRSTSLNGHGPPTKPVTQRDNIMTEAEWNATGGGGWREEAERQKERRAAEFPGRDLAAEGRAKVNAVAEQRRKELEEEISAAS